MDRRQGRARLLALVGLFLLCGAADQPRLPIKEARWLKSPDLARDLTRLPPECLGWPRHKQDRQQVAVGRALFRSPLLLGGQAARAGLSCASCHRNGRGNPHFHFPGISNEPGTADVTASLMSEHRGDGTFNPKPIPDLAGDPAKLKISRDPEKDDLKRFIRGLIVEEFDGHEPSQAALNSIAAYVRALSPGACAKSAGVSITLNSMLRDVDSAVLLAARAYADGDNATGRALLAAARSALGSIDERFQVSGLEASRTHLRAADDALFRLQRAGAAGPWQQWKRDWPRRKRALRSAESRSLFNPAVLRRLVAAS